MMIWTKHMLVIFIFFLDDFQIQSYVSALHKNIKQLLNLKSPHIHPYKNFTNINATVLDKIRIQIALSPNVNGFLQMQSLKVQETDWDKIINQTLMCRSLLSLFTSPESNLFISSH